MDSAYDRSRSPLGSGVRNSGPSSLRGSRVEDTADSYGSGSIDRGVLSGTEHILLFVGLLVNLRVDARTPERVELEWWWCRVGLGVLRSNPFILWTYFHCPNCASSQSSPSPLHFVVLCGGRTPLVKIEHPLPTLLFHLECNVEYAASNDVLSF